MPQRGRSEARATTSHSRRSCAWQPRTAHSHFPNAGRKRFRGLSSRSLRISRSSPFACFRPIDGLAEHSDCKLALQLAQNAVRLTQAELDDLVRAGLGIRIGVDSELWSVSG